MERDFFQHVWSRPVEEDLRRIVRLAVFEDLDRGQDWTTVCLVPEEAAASASIVARRPGVIAGVPTVPVILDEMEIEAQYHPLIQDGDAVTAGAIIARLSGPARDLLTSERMILNILGRLSGVATLTHQYVAAIAGAKARLYDTRKTIPGWRRLDKYAVHCGGGHNHRTGLYDAILIKDNHLAFGHEETADRAYTPAEAIRKARQFLSLQRDNLSPPPTPPLSPSSAAPPGTPDPNMLLEIEVDSLDQLHEVLPENPDLVLLDNMTPDQLRQAVQIRDAAKSTAELEASGGITLENIRAIAETGIDRISIGALTHSAPTLDLALDWQ
jgi:nicotinate-nucleotide pyrophosphorylase (carboxylating)